MCVCGAYQREGVQKWIGVLQEQYPSLAKANIIYDITELEIVKTDGSNSDHREQPKLAASS